MLNSGNIFFTILIWFWIRFDDMNLICFELGVMISIWFWYGFWMVLIRFWYDFDTILIWFCYGFDMVPASWLQKKKQKQRRDRFLVNVSRIFMVLVWFWSGFDAILVRFWYASDTILIRFWYDFDPVFIWFHQKKTPRVRSGTFVLASRWSMHVRPRGASAPA